MAVVSLTKRLLDPQAGATYSTRIGHIPLVLPEASPLSPASWSALPYTLLTPSVGDVAAVVLVLCGAGDNRHAFKLVLFRALLEHSMAVLTIDPPGHGDFLAQPCTRRNLQAACTTAIDWLAETHPAARIGVLGISLGGCQALDLASRDARVQAVVSVSTPVHLQPITRKLIAREVLQLGLPRNLALLRHFALPALWAEWRSVKGAWFGESLYDLVAGFEPLHAVRAIGARPKLFVHGTRDVAVPPSHAQQLYDSALSDKALMWVRQATHLSVILFEQEMRQVARWLRAKLSADYPARTEGG